MIKIYFQSKSLFLTDTITGEIDNYLHQKETIFIDELNVHTIKTMIKEMERDEIYRGVFLHNDLEELLHAFKTELHTVIAAGGLVFDHNQVLLIFRRGKWDLPKGKLDEGEQIEACAVREVEEETGLKGVQLIDRLMITYHTYHEKNKHVLKESHWFTMKADSRQPLQPQFEEDIAECKWVETGHLEPYFSRMHGSVQDVLEKGVNSV